MAKADIWCEVVCSCCGNVVGLYYKNAASIKKLKELTKNWTKTEDNENLCPECAGLSK